MRVAIVLDHPVDLIGGAQRASTPRPIGSPCRDAQAGREAATLVAPSAHLARLLPLLAGGSVAAAA